VIVPQLPQTSPRRLRGYLDRGAVAVEMALVSPLLVLMIVGIIDFSRVFNAELQLSQAAREGVRLASLQLGTLNLSAIQNRAVLAAQHPAFGAALPAGNVTVLSSCTATPLPTDLAKVRVTYVYQGIFYMKNSTLTQEAVMRCGG